MSEVSDTARVAVLLADYAAIDAINKINVLGLGWQVTGIDPASGQTAPQALVVMLEVEPTHIGETYAFEVALYDEAGDLVQVPGPTGELQALRIAKPFTADRPAVAGQHVPRGAVWAHAQAVLTFPSGLPLTAGRSYTWQVSIDGNHNPGWSTSFYVADAPRGPIVG